MSTEVASVGRRGRGSKSGRGAEASKDAVLVDEEVNGQKLIPGTERLSDPEIEAQADTVKTLELKRKKILEKEIDERAKLTKMMKDKGVSYYPLSGDLEGYVAEIETEPKAKIHKAKKKDEDDE